jgi:HK97 family phage prohead protease
MPSFRPTREMAAEARRGLAWRREHNRGGTEIGVARARNISNRDMLPIETINRMVSYFARHETDKQGEGFSPGEPGFPSAGRIAWALWGGDAGQTWANAIVERVNDTTARAANAYAGDMIYLTSSNVKIAAAAEGETEAPARTIEGVAVPYNTVAVVSGGEKVMFLPGSLPVDGKAPRLLENHDGSKIIGVVTARMDDEEEMRYTARISATKAGDDVIELVKDGALDAVSVGVDPVEASYNDDGILVISKANWRELSIVAEPAFSDATIDRIAAAKVITTEQEKPMTEIQTPVEKPAEAPKAPIWAEARKAPSRLPSMAEWVSAYVQGGEKFAAVNRMIADHQAYHNPVAAAAGDIATTDTPGLLPVPVVGPVFDNINYLRPVVSAIGARAMPLGAGKTFNRPEITTHTSVAQQASELATLSSTTMVVSSNIVTRLTFGGTVLVSEQDVDWTDPASVDIILQDLAGQYADATDNYAADQLYTNSTNRGTWTGSATTLVAEIYALAQWISASSNVLPTHMFVSPATWAKIGGLVDGNNRPLFPTVAPFNAAGTQDAANWNGNPLGLTMVVDKNFSTGAGADRIIVGTAAGRYAGFEIYENQRGLVAIDKPEVLGRQISFRGYFATLMIDATKFAYVNWT